MKRKRKRPDKREEISLNSASGESRGLNRLRLSIRLAKLQLCLSLLSLPHSYPFAGNGIKLEVSSV